MSLQVTSLNSGSNGNCYYIGNGKEAVLIDAGISCRETEKRMIRLGLTLNNVKAIFISHEHSDHISGVSVLAKKYNLTVYVTYPTYKGCSFRLPDDQLRHFRSGDTMQVGDLAITAFSKLHDASDPQSFVVEGAGKRVGVFTDIGAPCSSLLSHFNSCHAAFLEANYDEDMLHNGRYPYHLKKRISGGKGHLSNSQALDCFLQHKASYLQCLILSHLSKENNCPKLVYQLFKRHAGNTQVFVASRYEALPLYSLTSVDLSVAASSLPATHAPQQMSLFE